MYPFDLEEFDDIESDITDFDDNYLMNFSDYEIDFDNNCLTGRIITGLEAVKQWIKIVLNTERYSFYQYSWDYGSELNTLIGKRYDKDFITSEVNRMINDCLVSDTSGIDSIEDLNVDFNDDTITCSFNVNTLFGEGEIDNV